MTTKATKALTIAIPCYIDRFLCLLSQKTGMDKEVIALFFLSQKGGTRLASSKKTLPIFLTQKAGHAQSRRRKTIKPICND